MIIRHLTAGLLLASALSACTVLPDREPLPLALRIITPSSSNALQTIRILVSPDGNTLSSYQGARWADPNPNLLREQLVQAFEQDGSFSAVTTETQSLQADVHLMSDLRQFQTRYQGEQASVIIELDAKLIDPSTREVLAAKRFSIRQPLQDTAIESVVNNFGTASEQLAGELLAWSRSALGDFEPLRIQ